MPTFFKWETICIKFQKQFRKSCWWLLYSHLYGIYTTISNVSNFIIFHFMIWPRHIVVSVPSQEQDFQRHTSWSFCVQWFEVRGQVFVLMILMTLLTTSLKCLCSTQYLCFSLYFKQISNIICIVFILKWRFTWGTSVLNLKFALTITKKKKRGGGLKHDLIFNHFASLFSNIRKSKNREDKKTMSK